MTVQTKNRNKKNMHSLRTAQEAKNGIAQTLVNLNTTREGLQEVEASVRLARDGMNEVAHDKPPHALLQLLMAFNNPFIYVLAILAGISFFTDYWLPTSHGEEGDLTTCRSAESDGAHNRNGSASRPRGAKRHAP